MVWTKFFTVEVILLLCGFGMILEASIYINLFVYKSCYVILGYNKADCAKLGYDTNNESNALEKLVQPTVNKILMAQAVTGTLFPMIFNLYVGTWSDKFGRKPFLILTLIGNIASTIGGIFIVHFDNISPWWYLLISVPAAVTGGYKALFMLISAYLVDVSTAKDRAIRFSVYDVVYGFASFASSLASARLLFATSYETIFIIVGALQVISLIYTVLFIPESVKKGDVNRTPKAGDLLNNIGLKGIAKDVFRKRENNGRKYLLVFIATQLLLGFSGGTSAVASLLLRAKLDWNLTKITTVSSITSIINLIGTIVGTFFLYKYLKIKEIKLALFATVTSSIYDIIWGLSTNDYVIYSSYVINIFGGLTGLMWRTLTSCMVAPDEIGKLLAFQSILDSFNTLFAHLAYNKIYSLTIDINSGLYNFVSLGLHIIVVIIMIFMLRLKIPFYQAPPAEKDETHGATNTKKSSLNVVVDTELNKAN